MRVRACLCVCACMGRWMDEGFESFESVHHAYRKSVCCSCQMELRLLFCLLLAIELSSMFVAGGTGVRLGCRPFVTQVRQQVMGCIACVVMHIRFYIYWLVFGLAPSQLDV